MTEAPGAPSTDNQTSPGACGLSPVYADLAAEHLTRVDGEVAARRTMARALIEAHAWKRLEMPAWEEDRFSTYLNFVVRTDDVDGLRRHLLSAGFDSRRDYIRPVIDDEHRFPVSCALTRRGLYLPIRSMRSEAQLHRLRDALIRFDAKS